MNESTTPAGIFRRLAALIYDIFAVVAIALLVTGISLGIATFLQKNAMLTATDDTALTTLVSNSIGYQVFLCLAIVSFYAWFWTHGGQTIGMRVWRLRVQNSDGSSITTTQALIRLATAAFGLGNMMLIFDPKKRAFQDLWAKCEVVLTEKIGK